MDLDRLDERLRWVEELAKENKSSCEFLRRNQTSNNLQLTKLESNIDLTQATLRSLEGRLASEAKGKMSFFGQVIAAIVTLTGTIFTVIFASRDHK